MSLEANEQRVGIVLVTHGPSGPDMLTEVTRLLGAAITAGMLALDVPATEPRDHLMERLQAAVRDTDQGAGVVIACDLHGSTPTNCAVELMKARHVVVVCGVNLPMVVKLASAARPGVSAEEVGQAAVDTAVRSIRVERKP
jgi:PTS system mannose-specific IIA component